MFIVLKLIIIGYTLSAFEPLTLLFRKNKVSLLKGYLKSALFCAKCLSFWLSLIYFSLSNYPLIDIISLSGVVSLGANLISKTLDLFPTRL